MCVYRWRLGWSSLLWKSSPVTTFSSPEFIPYPSFYLITASKVKSTQDEERNFTEHQLGVRVKISKRLYCFNSTSLRLNWSWSYKQRYETVKERTNKSVWRCYTINVLVKFHWCYVVRVKSIIMVTIFHVLHPLLV